MSAIRRLPFNSKIFLMLGLATDHEVGRNDYNNTTKKKKRLVPANTKTKYMYINYLRSMSIIHQPKDGDYTFNQSPQTLVCVCASRLAAISIRKKNH